jgi:hypothetical protein
LAVGGLAFEDNWESTRNAQAPIHFIASSTGEFVFFSGKVGVGLRMPPELALELSIVLLLVVTILTLFLTRGHIRGRQAHINPIVSSAYKSSILLTVD